MGDDLGFCGFDIQEYQGQLFTVQGELGTQIEQHQTLVEDNAKTNGEPAPGKLTQPTEDPSEKVDRFEGGVDEIADQIEDLQAFEDLCEALDDDEPYQSALSRVRSSGPYKKLCEMWAGALEGGGESSRMQRAFNNMFDGRGFWASTEKAFSMVASAAKRDAMLPKEARDAKGKAQDAKGKGNEANEAKNSDKADAKQGQGQQRRRQRRREGPAARRGRGAVQEQGRRQPQGPRHRLVRPGREVARPVPEPQLGVCAGDARA
jgi:hypothetical protein